MDAIPFVDLVSRHSLVAAQVEANVLEVLRSGHYIGGPFVSQLETEIAERCGRAHGVGVASGTDGLILALAALGVGAGDEVIVPAISFVATASAVLCLGAVPVVVDVLPDRPLMDPVAANAAVCDRTAAVVPVHLFGDAAPPLNVTVPVVDDAAQAMGRVGAVGAGQACVLSFYPTKVLGGAGDGGMVLTDDEAMARALRSLANHRGMPNSGVGHRGTNSRLDALQAAVLLGHLPALDERIRRRRAIARRFDAVAGTMAIARDPESPVTVCAFRHPDRAAVCATLAELGVETRLYYSNTLASHPAVAQSVRCAGALTNGERFANEAFAVPCYAGLSEASVDRICRALERAA